jgi:hypothetical protein
LARSLASGVPTGTCCPGLHQDLIDDAGLEDLDLNRALLRLDHGDHVAAPHLLARLLQPFHQGAGLHVGAKGRHDEVAHDGLTRLLALAAIASGCGSAACVRRHHGHVPIAQERQQLGDEQRPRLEVDGRAPKGVLERRGVVHVDRHHSVNSDRLDQLGDIAVVIGSRSWVRRSFLA